MLENDSAYRLKKALFYEVSINTMTLEVYKHL